MLLSILFILLIKKKKNRFKDGAIAGAVISQSGSADPDPDQNKTDPQHFLVQCS